MTPTQFKKVYEKHHEEFCKFEKIKTPLSKRPDLHAFLLLDKLQPEEEDIICAAEHDVIYLSIDVLKLAKIITEEQIIELIQCGVSYYGGDNFEMFV